MNILITGAAGYIGSALINKLNKQPSVHITAIDNLMYNQWFLVKDLFYSKDNVEFHNLDCSKPLPLSMLEKQDVIIPLAAYVGAPLCEKFPKESQAINVEQIKNIVGAVNKNQLIIYPNSNSGLGSVEGVADENTPRKSVSLYGMQKDEAEDVVKTHDYHIVFRLATLFGTSFRNRSDLLVNNLVYQAFFNKKLMVFDPHFKRNFIHVDDVVSALIFGIQNRTKMAGEAYNLGNDELNTTKGELAKTICRKLNAVYEEGEGNDPDKRNYNVSSQKLYNTGYKCYRDLDYGINQLLYYYQYLPKDEFTRNIILNFNRNY